jgi:hypothetical protein
METFDTFREKMKKIKQENDLIECNKLGDILDYMIKNKEEFKQFDRSQYSKCNNVKSILEKNNQ